MAEKTEKATPKKLRDARKKGQVAKSKEFPSAFTFIVSIGLVLAMSSTLYEKLASYLIVIFRLTGTNINMQTRGGGFIAYAMQMIFETSVPIMVITSLVGIVVNFLVVGPLFSMQAMKPDIKKLNPVTNLKNLFKLKTFVELIKSILKITGALLLIYSVVYDKLGDIIATVNMPVIGALLVFSSFLLQVILRVGIFFIAIAVFDLVYQKYNFGKEMRMEKFEVKQEYKDTEGDPHVKGRRRQIAQEMAYRDGPEATKRARTVITNPIHIAVALEYNPEKEPAPKIATMGIGDEAKRIIEIALDNNIPIMRNIPLAHELYEMGTISHYIPEETYQAVAEVLKWLQKLEEEKEYNVELFR